MDNGASSYRRYLDGDDNGMVDIIRDYKDGLLLYINTFTDNLSEAEDLMEDTFVKLAVNKPKFSEKSSFKTWLYAIGRNVVLDELRRRRRKKVITVEEIGVSDTSDTELEYIVEEDKKALHKAIGRLKPDYRQVLYLRYFEQCSNADTAVIMHKTKKQVENLIFRAGKALKAELDKEGFVYEKL